MDRSELMDNFRQGFFFLEGLNEEFDLNKTNKTKEYYNNEFLKFLHLWRCYFFSKNRLVTVWNSYELNFKDGVIKHLFELFNYFYKISNNTNCLTIGIFLLLLEQTLKQPENCKSKSHNLNIKEFYNAKQEYIEIFNEIENEINVFFEESVDYYLKEDDSPIIDMIYAMMNVSKEDTKNAIIEKYIEANKYLWLVSQYDKNLSKHKDKYLNHILDCAKNDYNEEQFLPLFEDLCKKKILNSNEIKNVLNEYIIRTNDLKYVFQEGNNLVRVIASIDVLLDQLNQIKQFNIDKSIKERIKECIVVILQYKRLVLSNSDYINSNMQVLKVPFTIPNEEIERLKEIIKEDTTSYYRLMLVDLDHAIESSIDLYLKSPMLQLVSRFELNSSQETYDAGDNSNTNNCFSKYVNELGYNYAKSKNVELNKAPYDIFIQNEKNSFNWNQMLVYNLFSEEEYEQKIIELGKRLGIHSKNRYANLVETILKTEYSVIRILEKNNINPDYKNGYENICTVFELILNSNENSTIKKNILNGLFYIIYVMYGNLGYNLRNNVMHGVLIGQNYKLELLMAYTCYIIILVIEYELNENNKA